jgi:hypothetical protein
MFNMVTLGPYISGTKFPRNIGPTYTCVGGPQLYSGSAP